MSEPELKRQWWRMKRWRAAVALWILVAYPLSLGPAFYANGRGWIGQPSGWLIYAPVIQTAHAIASPGVLRETVSGYVTADEDTGIVTYHDQRTRNNPPWLALRANAAVGAYWRFVYWHHGVGVRHAK